MIRDARPYEFLIPTLPQHGMSPDSELIPYDLMLARLRTDLDWQFGFIREVQACCPAPIFHIEAPPPVRSEALMLKSVYAHFATAMEEFGCPTVSHRFKQWWIWTHTAKEICDTLGVRFITAPPETRDEEGFLAEAYHLDGVHGNDAYGALVARDICKMIAANQHSAG